MLYFAYGSNMDWDQMKERCPSARFVGVAELRGYRLAFTRRSVKRGCGVCDAVSHSSKYKNLLVSGARRWRSPDAYIKQLEAIEVSD